MFHIFDRSQNKATHQTLARLIAALLFTAVLAGEWDVWWHVSVGRDTFWEPPHIMLYGSLVGAIFLGIYGWYKFREGIWRRIAIALGIVPLLAPLDEFWHQWFGVENLTSPFIVWALPHVLLILAIAAALLLTLPLIHRDESSEARRVFGAGVFAAMLSLGMILAIPTNPIGAYHVIGFYGSILGAFFVALAYLFSQKWIGGFAAATLFTVFYLSLYLAGVREKVGEGIIIPPHATFPPWLVVFTYLTLGLWTDFSSRFRPLLRGAGLGFLFTFGLYFFSNYFIDPRLQYSAEQTFEVIGSGIVGGILAGIIFKRSLQR